MTRVHVEDVLAPGARVALGRAAARHVRQVLRLGPGDGITLFNGDGTDYVSRIGDLGRDEVKIEVLGTAPAAPESPLSLHLIQGIARSERMDIVVQKATELGVAAIQPVVTVRSVVKLDAAASERKRAHWRGVAIAACEQCGRAKLPGIAAPVPLSQWLGEPGTGALRLLLAVDSTTSLVDVARGANSVELLVGPEGGLDESERDAARRARFLACRLGPRILRSETAAIAAITALQSVAGDLGGDSHL